MYISVCMYIYFIKIYANIVYQQVNFSSLFLIFILLIRNFLLVFLPYFYILRNKLERNEIFGEVKG